MKNKFIERFSELIKSSGKSQTEISNELGIRKQKITNWKTGYVEPNLDDLIMIATYFNVTSDYLIGLEQEAGNRNGEELEYTTTSLKYRRK